MSQYGSVEYWNERYTREENAYEWYMQYAALKEVFTSNIKKDDKILVVGCGNSSLSEDLYREGFANVTSCDYSAVVIEKMRAKCQEKTGMKWDIEDVQRMSYQDESFDVVVDKGTLDALICGDEAVCNPDTAISEINRVLSKDGVYICITFGMPENRMDYLQKPTLPWKITHVTISKADTSRSTSSTYEPCHHVYVCRKSK